MVDARSLKNDAAAYQAGFCGTTMSSSTCLPLTGDSDPEEGYVSLYVDRNTKFRIISFKTRGGSILLYIDEPRTGNNLQSLLAGAMRVLATLRKLRRPLRQNPDCRTVAGSIVLARFFAMASLFVLVVPGAHGATRSRSGCSIRWDVVPTNAPEISSLDAVDAVSGNDVWAVGETGDLLQNQQEPLIEHWDGSRWMVVPSEAPRAPDFELRDVFARERDDIWAVGGNPEGASPRTLIEHFDGQRWTQVSSPNALPGGNSNNEFLAVAVVAASDAWAGGFGSYPDALLARWNGKRWVRDDDRKFNGAGSFSDIAAIGTANVWAVAGTDYRSFFAHWNGRQWKITRKQRQYVYGVAALSSRNVWAVGEAGIQHFDGHKWTTLPRSSTGLRSGQTLYSVDAASARATWAVGASYDAELISHPVAVRRADSHRWVVLQLPQTVRSAVDLLHVSAVSDREAWAVGYRPLHPDDADNYDTTAVILHARCAA